MLKQEKRKRKRKNQLPPWVLLIWILQKYFIVYSYLQFSLLVAVGWMTMGLGSVGTQTSDKEAELCLSDLFFFCSFLLTCFFNNIHFTNIPVRSFTHTCILNAFVMGIFNKNINLCDFISSHYSGLWPLNLA